MSFMPQEKTRDRREKLHVSVRQQRDDDFVGVDYIDVGLAA